MLCVGFNLDCIDIRAPSTIKHQIRNDDMLTMFELETLPSDSNLLTSPINGFE